MANKLKNVLLICCISCFLSSNISAEEKLKGPYTDSDTLEYTLPEIIVKGDNSMRSLELEVIKAEELKFKVFNNLNSTDDFDITCEWRAPLGTLIKKWSCDVGYMKKAKAEAARDWLENLGQWTPSEVLLAGQNAHKTRALNKEMRVLAIQYPELAVAMVNAHELKEFYKQERRRRYKDSIFVGKPKEPDLKMNKITILEAVFQDHRNGLISDKIWQRWDSMYRKLFRIRSYRTLWKKADHKKYEDDFVEYVNKIMAGR